MCNYLNAAEYSANAAQIIQPGASAIFQTKIRDRTGRIYHREETGLFRLASPSLMGYGYGGCCCGCGGMPTARYLVLFGGNISVPTGGTVEEILMALSVDGAEDPSSIMRYTPAAVDVAGNVSTSILVEVPWICRCSSLSVTNESTQPIQLENANLVIDFAGVGR